MRDDTIMALASGAGRAGVAVVRISGPSAETCLAKLSRKPLPEPRYAATRPLFDGEGRVLDHAMVLRFKAPASFTGEDVTELHLHGGRAVIDGVMDALGDLGVRMAEPGEFSRRAFENGKMDLTQAEAISDLVAAETLAQRDQALRQADGALSALYDRWRQEGLQALALLEAWLDFPEEDLPDDVLDGVRDRLIQMEKEIVGHLALADQGERVRDGVRVVLAGAPNAGKSTLLNLLAGREAAIVSPTPGTTRDVLEVTLQLGGYEVHLFDTAGLRESKDEVEKEGVSRAQKRYDQADLRVWLVDSTMPHQSGNLPNKSQRNPDLVVWTKVDLNPLWPTERQPENTIGISCLTGDGVDVLQAMLKERVGAISFAAAPAPNRRRHRQHLEEAIASIQRGTGADTLELLAEDIRAIMTSLGHLTGRIDVEDVLDIVFREFCIGK